MKTFVIIYCLFSNIDGKEKKLSETSHIPNWQMIREQKSVELLESTKPTVYSNDMVLLTYGSIFFNEPQSLDF